METNRFDPSKSDNAVQLLPLTALDSIPANEVLTAKATPDNNQDTALGFFVGTLGLMLNASIFCEIVDHAKVSPLPNVQPWFSGVLNLRGNIVPVVDLHRLLQEEIPGNTKHRRLLAIDRGRKAVAFWIDGYPQLLSSNLPDTNIPPALPTLLNQAVTGCRRHNTQIWLSISLDKLLKSMTLAVGAEIKQ